MIQQSCETQRISRIRVGARAVSPMSVVNYVTEGESRRATPPKLESRRVSIALTLLCACFVLQGCTSVKKTLGIETDAPNEYAVTPGAALEMPPDFFYLPTPVPGMERPQDRAAREMQEEKFLGSAKTKEALSAGQKHLLEMSGAEGNQDNIRPEIDREAHMEVQKDPTIIEKIGLKKEKPKGDVINPYEEAERLKHQETEDTALREVFKPANERAEDNRVGARSWPTE